MLSSFFCSGTYSTNGFEAITTPAAWVDECLGKPSNVLLTSIRVFTLSSVSYAALSSGFISKAFSMVIPSIVGIILATLSTSA